MCLVNMAVKKSQFILDHFLKECVCFKSYIFCNRKVFGDAEFLKNTDYSIWQELGRHFIISESQQTEAIIVILN